MRGHQGHTQPGAEWGSACAQAQGGGSRHPPPGPLPRRCRARLRTGCPLPEDRTTSTLCGARGEVSTLTDASTKPPLTPNSAPSGCSPRSGCCLLAAPAPGAYLLLSARFFDENSAERRLERRRHAWTRPPGGTERPLLPRADAAPGGALPPPRAPHGRPHSEPHTAARRRARVWERGLENIARVQQLPSAVPPKASRNRPPRVTQDTRRNTSSRRPLRTV